MLPVLTYLDMRATALRYATLPATATASNVRCATVLETLIFRHKIRAKEGHSPDFGLPPARGFCKEGLFLVNFQGKRSGPCIHGLDSLKTPPRHDVALDMPVC